MLQTITHELAYILLNSETLLNTDGVGRYASSLWTYSTKFPHRTFDEVEIDENGNAVMRPQFLWNVAPANLLDDNSGTGYSFTLTAAAEQRIFHYIHRSSISSALQTIDRVTLNHSFSGTGTVRVMVSLDAYEWTEVYEGVIGTTGVQVLAAPVQCRYVCFEYAIVAGPSEPYGTLTINSATPSNGGTQFVTDAPTALGLRGAVLVDELKSGGLTDGSGNAFTPTYPYLDALNVFTSPYTNDNRNARPAIYFGVNEYERNDTLEYQTVSTLGISEHRKCILPLVITVVGANYRQAIIRRDLLRAKVRRILMQNKINRYWDLLEISGTAGDKSELDTISASGGATGTGIWEGIAMIPVHICYRVDESGDLRI